MHHLRSAGPTAAAAATTTCPCALTLCKKPVQMQHFEWTHMQQRTPTASAAARVCGKACRDAIAHTLRPLQCRCRAAGAVRGGRRCQKRVPTIAPSGHSLHQPSLIETGQTLIACIECHVWPPPRMCNGLCIRESTIAAVAFERRRLS